MDVDKAIHEIGKRLKAAERVQKRERREWERANKGHRGWHGPEPADAPSMFFPFQEFIQAHVDRDLDSYTFKGRQGPDAVFAWAASRPPKSLGKASGRFASLNRKRTELSYVQEILRLNKQEHPEQDTYSSDEDIAGFIILRAVNV